MEPGIYAKDTALFELVDRDALFESIATGFGFTEGPVFSRQGFLLFSDLRSEKIHQYTVPWWEGDITKGELTVFREQSNRDAAERMTDQNDRAVDPESFEQRVQFFRDLFGCAGRRPALAPSVTRAVVGNDAGGLRYLRRYGEPVERRAA